MGIGNLIQMFIDGHFVLRRAASLLCLVAVLAGLHLAVPECSGANMPAHCARVKLADIASDCHTTSDMKEMECCHSSSASICAAEPQCSDIQTAARNEKLTTGELRLASQQQPVANETLSTSILRSAVIDVAEDPPSKPVFELKTDLRI